MNRTTRFSILVMSLLLFGGCIGNVYVRMSKLSDEDLEWYDDFIRNDSSFFMSGNGDYSRLIVESCTVVNTAKRFFISAAHDIFDDFTARAEIVFRIDQDTCDIPGYYAINKPVDNDSLAIYGRLGNRAVYGHPQFSYTPHNPTPIYEFSHADYHFSECYILDSANSVLYPYSKMTDSIERMVISRNEGLIYYSYSSGKEYFRVFNESTADSLRKVMEQRRIEENQVEDRNIGQSSVKDKRRVRRRGLPGRPRGS